MIGADFAVQQIPFTRLETIRGTDAGPKPETVVAVRVDAGRIGRATTGQDEGRDKDRERPHLTNNI